MILTDFLDISQNNWAEDFKKFLPCSLISCNYGVFLFLLALNVDLEREFFEVVHFKVLGGVVKSLEEVHNVPQSNIHFHFIDALENLSGLDLAVNKKGDLRSV